MLSKLKFILKRVARESMSAGDESLLLAARVAFASAASFPSMSAWPAIQWTEMGVELAVL